MSDERPTNFPALTATGVGASFEARAGCFAWSADESPHVGAEGMRTFVRTPGKPYAAGLHLLFRFFGSWPTPDETSRWGEPTSAEPLLAVSPP